MKKIQMIKNQPLSLISTTKIIQMSNVSTSYDSKNFALKGINLSIDRGTNYAIVGQSGSGKSTLLKLMNGMMISSNGTIKIDYVVPDMNDKKFKKMMHTIGYIPQSLGLIKNITVIENILIGALPRLSKIQSLFKRFPEHEIQEAKRILKLVALSGKENRKVYMLSGGEKRRVAIARALMQKPTILLADEIVSELDHVTAHEIMDLIADAQKQMNLTAIMVHHDMQLALEYANRVAVIKDGEKILEIGVEGEKIVDFQTGDMSAEEIMEMYSNDSKK
ncbi:ATP-binding cassette domain-containing protein [Marine Group I thaumarchaeote]|jgi:phosphonate transport system ATP-binding protein|uniref:ATP-binding cassette domain-containing protein n=1 Tax=Marine Group I thaumarchaeote TaxID=2511932 RepID=A0A7K4MX78_9ARCH|nr:MAG: ATP-binding cassette domain-containing protein [Nitrosopumilus sp. YT1]NMI82852.1 ATP-binding cassette domain-containing protein [Candidatus Nitrosopumilus sp. MTA1]NWJ28850.1 ATP-binding cassette domain-containing protein [Marine Group I thaumarchaeote]NWJ57421.1 ATP-binding cassette domain-containing protein [Marine Group I thaumarchaeote]NWJ83780.1 ATP-binding cassette domain-containing protein [Marine Group I thaumarchaeote]